MDERPAAAFGSTAADRMMTPGRQVFHNGDRGATCRRDRRKADTNEVVNGIRGTPNYCYWVNNKDLFFSLTEGPQAVSGLAAPARQEYVHESTVSSRRIADGLSAGER